LDSANVLKLCVLETEALSLPENTASLVEEQVVAFLICRMEADTEVLS
jgi:hypothetical protein